MCDSLRFLIVYGSRYGQTAKVAQRLGDVLRERGHDATVVDAARLPHGLTLAGVDGIIVGSSVVFGRHTRAVRRFVRQHIGALNAGPSGFFSVSGAEASPIESVRATARRALDQFLSATGWHPARGLSVAGAYVFSRYPFPLRWVMRRIVKHNGGTSDGDREYTDWHQVAQFADAIAAVAAGYSGTHSGPAVAARP
jgi:menaquinone-dependent protoporphyrinogen oxidase